MQGWQPRRLTPTQLEERRLVAARWLRAGRLSQAEIARRLGVSEAAVSGWKRKLAAAGLAGFDTERWTLRRVAAVVRRECGVRYHPRSLGRVLRRHGWTRHHPATQARERDEALIAAWLARDWPRVKRGLAASGPRLPSWTRRVTRFGPA